MTGRPLCEAGRDRPRFTCGALLTLSQLYFGEASGHTAYVAAHREHDGADDQQHNDTGTAQIALALAGWVF